MPITVQEKLPPIGSEYACEHDGHEYGAEHAYGGGYHEIEMKLDSGEPCSSFWLQFDYSDPCTDCVKQCKTKVTANDAGEYDLVAAQMCSNCSGIATVTGKIGLWTFKSCQPGMIFSVSAVPCGEDPAPATSIGIRTQAEALGSTSTLRVGGLAVVDKSLPYYSRKTVMSPTGAATEECAGIVMSGFHMTQDDYDSCCDCPTVPRCTRFCVKKEGSAVVGLAAPVEPLTTGTDWAIYYEADPASPVNSFFYLLDPATAPSATAVALPDSYALDATPGDMRAAIYYKC